jgi:opacity protein-like surface antigen
MRFLIAVIYIFFVLHSFAEESVNIPVEQPPSIDKYYTGFHAGYSYTFSPNKQRFDDETTGDSAQVGLMVGRYFDNNVRVELEGSFKTKSLAKSPSGSASAIKEQSFVSLLGLINIYKHWDYREDSTIQPFVMVGAGISQNTSGDFKTFDSNGNLTSHLVGKKSKHFAYQFGTGISLKINQNAYLDFSGRYIYRGGVDTTSRRIATSSGAETSQSPEKAIMKDVLALVTVRLNM